MRTVTLRNLLARKLRLVMSALAIILGVAFVSGSFIFTDTIQRTFDGIASGTVPDVTVRFDSAGNSIGPEQLLAVDGRVIEPSVVEDIAGLDEVERADGSVDGFGLFLLDDQDRLIGGQGAPTLAFNDGEAINTFGEKITEYSSGRPPENGDEIVIDTRTVERQGFELGDTISAILPGDEPIREFELVGTAGIAGGGGLAGATLVTFDTQTAQEIFLDGEDGFNSILVAGAGDVSQEDLAAAVREVLPEDLEAVTGDDYTEEIETDVTEGLGFISTFLLIFAGIALVVGTFLIVNTFSILVAQRSRELALLRALGASNRQVSRSVLTEAAVVGFLGSALGLVVGYGLAQLLRWLFSQFGLDLSGTSMTIEPRTVLASFAVGVPITVLAAFVPARRAAKVPPIAALRDEVAMPELAVGRRVLIGTVLAVAGAGAMAAGLGGYGVYFADVAFVGFGVLGVLLGVAFLSPLLARPIIAAIGWPARSLAGVVGHLATQNSLRNPRRTAATASALMIGVTLVATMAVLGSSVNKSIDASIDEEFTADFMVSNVIGQPFSPAIAEEVRAIDGVGTVSAAQAVPTRIDDETVFLGAIDSDEFNDIYTLEMIDGTSSLDDRQIVLSEARAESLGVGVGDEVEIEAGAGTLTREVVGVFAESNVAGNGLVTRAFVDEAGLRSADTNLSVNVADGVDASQVQEAVKDAVAQYPLVAVQNKDDFSDAVRAQINQLLYLIYGLLGLAIVIAVLGIVNTLALSVIERTREIGLLRAVGLTRGQLRGMVIIEAVTTAVFGAVLGLAMGVTFGTVLQQALQDEGVTHLGLPVLSLLFFLGLAGLFGVLAALFPARRAAKQNVLDAISTE